MHSMALGKSVTIMKGSGGEWRIARGGLGIVIIYGVSTDT